jgi:hypothetical protein
MSILPPPQSTGECDNGGHYVFTLTQYGNVGKPHHVTDHLTFGFRKRKSKVHALQNQEK